MKRIALLISIIMLYFTLEAQTIIKMEPSGGVYKVSGTVNGAKMKFIFDTGASTISMSMSMAEYLYDNDYIKDSDFIGKGKSQTADGNIVDHLQINLRDVEIGGVHLNNVSAIVIQSQNAPLLFGQSAIKKLGKIELNGNRLIISNSSNATLSKDDIQYFRRRLQEAWDENDYASVAEYGVRLFDVDALDNKGVWMLMRVNKDNLNNYEDAIVYCNALMDTEYATAAGYAGGSVLGNIFITKYECLALLGQNPSIDLFDKGIDLITEQSIEQETMNSINYWKGMAVSFSALNFKIAKMYDYSARFYKKSIQYFAKDYNLTFDDILSDLLERKGNYQALLDHLYITSDLCNYLESAYLSSEISPYRFSSYVRKLAQQNIFYAAALCDEYEIDY